METNPQIEILLKIFEGGEKYHDHKENMAWLATSLYFTYSIVFISWLLKADPDTGLFLCLKQIKLLGFIIIGFIYSCTFYIIAMHFKMRWKSADSSVIMRRYLFMLSAGHVIDIHFNDEGSAYPKEIEDQRESLTKKERNWKKCLRAFGLLIPPFIGLFIKEKNKEKNEEKNKNKKNMVDDRYKTEIPAYILISILCFAQIFVFWGRIG